MVTEQQVFDAVDLGLELLVRIGRHLLVENVNERSLSHRLAMPLETEIQSWCGESWNVDWKSRVAVSRPARVDFGNHFLTLD
jgi:hypothetical protein